MRLLVVLICLPFLGLAQYTGRQDDSLRKISDTMRFPKPFVFEKAVNIDLSPEALTKKCYNWLNFFKDSLKAIVIKGDSTSGKLMASNVPASPDITFTIQLNIKDSSYTCTLHNYLYHTINGKVLPVDKAATIKDYKQTTNIERALIMQNYSWVFESLQNYLEKGN